MGMRGEDLGFPQKPWLTKLSAHDDEMEKHLPLSREVSMKLPFVPRERAIHQRSESQICATSVGGYKFK